MSRKIIGATVGTTLPKPNLAQTDPKMGDYVKGREAVLQRIDTLEKQLAEHLYEPIVISSFTAKDAETDKSTLEIGTEVTSVDFAWAFSKQPKSITFNGNEMPVDSKGTTLSGLSIKTNTAWVLSVTDERDTTVQKSAGLTFLNGVYYGVCDDGDSGEAAIDGLTEKKLQSGRALTFTANAGAKQRIVYAIPSRYGTPVFNVGGFEGGFYKDSTIQYANEHEYTESYDVWLSDNVGLGSTTVKVS